jgi:hypothetical protein
MEEREREMEERERDIKGRERDRERWPEKRLVSDMCDLVPE